MSILTELEPAIYAGEDVTGRTYGQYTVLGKTRVHFYPSGSSHHIWLVRCSCGNEVETQAQKVTLAKFGCRECNKKIHLKTDSPHWKGGLYVSHYFLAKVKKGAERLSRTLPVEVGIDYLDSLWAAQNGRCAYTNIELIIGGNGEETTASLDRIDSSVGYIEGNVQFVHKDINRMKWTLSDGQFRKMCRLVTENDK